EGGMRGRGPAVPDPSRGVARGQLGRARGVGAVRDRLRGAPAPGQAGPPGAVRGAPAAQGLRPDDAGGQTVARRRRGRGDRGVTAHLTTLAALAVHFVPGRSFVNSLLHNFWLVLLLKVVLVMGRVLTGPLFVIYAELKI